MSHKRLNNYVVTSWTDMLEAFQVKSGEWCTYCFAAREHSKEGKEHVQAFVQSHWTIRAIGKKFNYHVEFMRGTQQQNKIYCTKEGLEHFEFGEWKEHGQGHRSDLDAMLMMARNGSSDYEIALKYPTQYIMYGKRIDYYREVLRHAKFKRETKRRVIFIQGPAGVGKTTKAYELCGCPKDQEMVHPEEVYVLSNSDNTMWWNGYNGQKYVIIDDYNGGMKIDTFLGVTDPWWNKKVQVGFGGWNCIMSSDVVIITSTQSLDAIFHDVPHRLAEVKRRVAEVLLLPRLLPQFPNRLNLMTSQGGYEGGV